MDREQSRDYSWKGELCLEGQSVLEVSTVYDTLPTLSSSTILTLFLMILLLHFISTSLFHFFSLSFSFFSSFTYYSPPPPNPLSCSSHNNPFFPCHNCFKIHILHPPHMPLYECPFHTNLTCMSTNLHITRTWLWFLFVLIYPTAKVLSRLNLNEDEVSNATIGPGQVCQWMFSIYT